ncbi:MAG: TonB-dependent receptor [Gammaproteobacteria bacterium]|nr:TonB-dependent receptor [Gammaproteobacteria bacterium]
MQAKAPRAFLLFAVAISFCFPAGFVYADDRELEEIIVTGTKRAASQQDTPIAISTLTADAIAQTRGNDIRAVGDLSPNVNLTLQTGFNAVAGGIRGTGTISILTTQDPSVGILVDEFALNHVQTQFVELFDLEQVEIYRGPQGTLFGKNSTGGVIAITSKRPDMEEFGGSFQVGTSSYGSDSDNYKVQFAVDVPLIPGELAFRFAGSQTVEDGFYFNDKDTAAFPNSPLYGALGVTPDLLPPELSLVTSGAGENLGGKDVFAAKAKLLWQPNDDFEAYFILETVRDDSDSPPGVNETPAGEGFLFELLGFPGIQAAGHDNPFSTGMTQQGNGINIRDGHRVDVDGYYLNLTYSMENYTIKSITGYREQEETLPSTYTGEAFLSLFDATRNLEREQFQQEVRLLSEFDGPINFAVGGIFISDDLDFRSYATVGLSSLFPSVLSGGPFFDDRGFLDMDLRGITGDPGGGQVKQERDSLAFYADGTYQFDDQWSLTVGVRHTRDEKSFYKPTGNGAPCNQFTEDRDAIVGADGSCIDSRSTAVSRAGLEGSQIDQRNAALPASQYAFVADLNEEWTETTWRVVLDYKDNSDNLWYASVATGFLAGGYSETCSQLQTCISYNPETNINYEIGFKGDLADGMLRFNASVFTTDFEDLQRNQVFRFIDPVSGVEGQETITLNAGESSSQGVEIETTWLATDNLTIRASLGYLDASYDVFDFEGVDLTALDIPFAAEIQAGIQATYVQALASGATLTYYLSAHYQDEAEMSPFDPNAVATGIARHPTFTQMEDRTLVDASVTYTSADEKYYAALFGKNITDETYRVSANSVGGLWNFTQYGAPSLIGFEFGVRFE